MLQSREVIFPHRDRILHKRRRLLELTAFLFPPAKSSISLTPPKCVRSEGSGSFLETEPIPFPEPPASGTASPHLAVLSPAWQQEPHVVTPSGTSLSRATENM
jgi:hypothetical protein